MPAPAAGIRIDSRAMAVPPPAAQDPSPPTHEPGAGGSVGRELLILGIALACGLLLMPFLIWLVGNRVLGPYTHGQDATAGTGPLRLLADYFTGLVHGSVIFWCVAAGPYVLVTLARLLYRYLFSNPGAATPGTPARPKPARNLERGRIEPHL
jgi:hypothetical protein